MENENIAEFVPLVDHEDYEILSVYPFTIRRKDNHYEIKEGVASCGYPRVNLNRKTYYKHILIAQQFLHNDDPVHKTEVDHTNRNRADYHIENLRWCTRSENQRNKVSSKGIQYEYVNDIPDDSIRITEYNGYEFDDYYYYDNNFYFYNGITYRKLYINEEKHRCLYVFMINTEGKSVKISLATFKRLHGIE